MEQHAMEQHAMYTTNILSVYSATQKHLLVRGGGALLSIFRLFSDVGEGKTRNSEKWRSPLLWGVLRKRWTEKDKHVHQKRLGKEKVECLILMKSSKWERSSAKRVSFAEAIIEPPGLWSFFNYLDPVSDTFIRVTPNFWEKCSPCTIQLSHHQKTWEQNSAV